jgi:hypothetical protein
LGLAPHACIASATSTHSGRDARCNGSSFVDWERICFERHKLAYKSARVTP